MNVFILRTLQFWEYLKSCEGVLFDGADYHQLVFNVQKLFSICCAGPILGNPAADSQVMRKWIKGKTVWTKSLHFSFSPLSSVWFPSDPTICPWLFRDVPDPSPPRGSRGEWHKYGSMQGYLWTFFPLPPASELLAYMVKAVQKRPLWRREKPDLTFCPFDFWPNVCSVGKPPTPRVYTLTFCQIQWLFFCYWFFSLVCWTSLSCN